jgi:transposase-like protein
VSYAQASQDLSIHQSQLRSWMKALADDPQHAFPDQGQMKPEQLEIARLHKADIPALMSTQQNHGEVGRCRDAREAHAAGARGVPEPLGPLE